MKRNLSIKLIFLSISLFGFSQGYKQDWVTYVTQKEKGPMVVTTNIYYNFMGKPNYKNLLVVGTNTRHCKKNGYPEELGLAKFYMFSDSISKKLDKLTKKRLVGVLTYHCSGFDVYYLKDTTNVRDSIQKFLDYNYAFSKNYLMLKHDKKWKHYKENLVPKDFSDGYFLNHDFLNQLVIDGDQLDKPRKVSHWINFRNEKQRKQFLDRAKKLEFSVDSLKQEKRGYYRYRAVVSRKDSVNPKKIKELSDLFIKMATIFYGDYGGWGSDPITDD